MEIKIKNLTNDLELPEYKTEGSAGMDLRANITLPMTLLPMERALVPTGIAIKLPEGYEAQVRARSGMALRSGIMMVNGVGTIDSDFTGEIGVILFNSSDVPFKIRRGDRIAQLVVSKFEKVKWVEGELGDTKRGDGGFGHTGR